METIQDPAAYAFSIDTYRCGEAVNTKIPGQADMERFHSLGVYRLPFVMRLLGVTRIGGIQGCSNEEAQRLRNERQE